MKARVGDRIVVESICLGGERRVGIITTIQHDDARRREPAVPGALAQRRPHHAVLP